MPEGKNATAAGGIDALDVLNAEYFIAQRGAEGANDGVDRGGDEGNLYAARPGKARKPGVVMQICGCAAFRWCRRRARLLTARFTRGTLIGWGLTHRRIV